MPNFKPKAKKKLKVSDKEEGVTLDSKHSEKMEEFHILKQEVVLPKLSKEKKDLKKN